MQVVSHSRDWFLSDIFCLFSACNDKCIKYRTLSIDANNKVKEKSIMPNGAVIRIEQMDDEYFVFVKNAVLRAHVRIQNKNITNLPNVNINQNMNCAIQFR